MTVRSRAGARIAFLDLVTCALGGSLALWMLAVDSSDLPKFAGDSTLITMRVVGGKQGSPANPGIGFFLTIDGRVVVPSDLPDTISGFSIHVDQTRTACSGYSLALIGQKFDRSDSLTVHLADFVGTTGNAVDVQVRVQHSERPGAVVSKIRLTTSEPAVEFTLFRVDDPAQPFSLKQESVKKPRESDLARASPAFPRLEKTLLGESGERRDLFPACLNAVDSGRLPREREDSGVSLMKDGVRHGKKVLLSWTVYTVDSRWDLLRIWCGWEKQGGLAVAYIDLGFPGDVTRGKPRGQAGAEWGQWTGTTQSLSPSGVYGLGLACRIPNTGHGLLTKLSKRVAADRSSSLEKVMSAPVVGFFRRLVRLSKLANLEAVRVLSGGGDPADTVVCAAIGNRASTWAVTSPRLARVHLGVSIRDDLAAVPQGYLSFIRSRESGGYRLHAWGDDGVVLRSLDQSEYLVRFMRISGGSRELNSKSVRVTKARLPTWVVRSSRTEDRIELSPQFLMALAVSSQRFWREEPVSLPADPEVWFVRSSSSQKQE